ncbi:MAG TPA: DUF5610 domain-containing protein [Candidatus Ozemobacteraceae bacterium]|nr:DUF5610 domain-containing protein [Candidatus Ozemobacteraceae bacterium]HQG29975.1 DUF5610 domain-containing protein [Candidatus Ozemobacteraceae bacterium]
MSEKIEGTSLQNAATLLSSLDAGKPTGKKAPASLSALLSGLNADQLQLSDDSRRKLQWAKSQFELSYQVIRSLNTAEGAVTSQETFSIKGSYEFLQKVSGREIGPDPENRSETGEAKEPAEQAEKDALTQLQEYFSPERTAERILDVALSFFGLSSMGQAEGNVESGRRKFADFIGSAIEAGFAQARGILGNLPEEIEAGIGRTHSLVFSGLEEFVTNGIAPEKLAAGGVMEKIVAYRQEMSLQVGSLRRAGSGNTVNYTASGDLKPSSPDSPTISTKG